MKLAINLFLSVAMLALSLWLIWPNHETGEYLRAAIDQLTVRDFGPYLLGYFALLSVVHVCRSWRWHYLLEPIGVRLDFARLLAVSSVGFMAILLVPARLGEFVRPALIRKKGHVSAAAALGTVAVERIIDGLIVSLMVFGCFFALRGPEAPGWMMPTAYIALGIFAVATVGLLLALRWPAATVRTSLRISLLPWVWPRLAERIEGKLLDLIRGFAVMKQPKQLAAFAAWSLAYWGINGVSTWLLARGMGLDLSLLGAMATMGLVAVGISLPNSPGLVGQFQWLTVLGLSLDLGRAAAEKGTPLYAQVLAYAIIIHALQVIWYVGTGLAALATRHVSFSELWASRKLDPEASAGHAPASEPVDPLPVARARARAGVAGAGVGAD